MKKYNRLAGTPQPLRHDISNKYIEKNSPALISGFWDALTIAPFFVWMEIWWFFGYQDTIYKKIRQEGKERMLSRKQN